MNPLFTQMLVSTILRKKKKGKNARRPMTDEELAREIAVFSLKIRTTAKDILFILTGIASAAFGLKSFLLPNGFIDGGATGLSLLITEALDWPLPLLILIVNIPFVLMGFRTVHRVFAIKATLAIAGLAAVLALVPFPEVTSDKLLVAVFGGVFLGAGIGLSVRGGGVLDGTEVLAIWLSKKIRTSIGDNILALNVVIFLVSALVLSIETALYSMLTYFAASKSLDFIIDGIEEYTSVTIISPKSELVRNMIIKDLGRGVTIYKGRGGYGKQGESKEFEIVNTVVTRLEVNRLMGELEKIDPEAFTVMSSVKDVKGGMIKKKGFQH